LQTASGLTLAVAANTTYTFSYYILFQSAATTTGMGLAVNTPAGATISYTAVIPTALDGTAASWTGWGTSASDTVLATATPAINTTYVAHIYGVVANGANAGNLSLQYRSEVSGSTVTVKASSWGALEVG
jgi:hypothetical protein